MLTNNADPDGCDTIGNVETQVFSGNFVHATETSPMEVMRDKIVGVSANKILFVEDSQDVESMLEEYNLTKSSVRQMKHGQFMVPGFIDTHIHAPQYLIAGTCLDKNLLDWLTTYTFPTEARFSDLSLAHQVYSKVVRRTLNSGTTTAAYYGTIHREACQILCDIVELEGQRAFVGKVNMDQHCGRLEEDTRESVLNTTRFVENTLKRKNPLVVPIVSPRFAGNCTRDLLRQLGAIAQTYGVPVQTHISETVKECDWIKQIYPEFHSYAATYDGYKLLTDKTVLAHGVYLSREELELIKQRGSGISHCANSNASLRSGILDVRNLLDLGVKVGLGTGEFINDVSGGYSPSVQDAMRTSLHVSNLLSLQKPPEYRWLTHQEVFMMATLGGAQVLGLDSKLGNFVVGKDFDALLVDCASPGSPIDIFSEDTISDYMQKFIYLGDDRNIPEVYVSGKRVK